MLLDFPDERRRHGLAYVEFAVNELYVIGGAKLDVSDSLLFFFYGLFRAQEATTPASVTELGKDENIIFQDGNSIIGAYFGTFAAKSALVFQYLRDGERNLFALGHFRSKEEMRIGFFHIAVKELNGMVSNQG
jgi:hypothetical protein